MGKLAKDSWRNRVVGFIEKPANQFTANALNFRRHPNNQRDAFRGLVSEIGFAGAVLENLTTGNLIDGHLRIEEALSIDENQLIPCVQVELTEAEEKLLLASYDPISAMATVDKEVLDTLLREVSTGDAAVQEMLSKLAEDSGLIPKDNERDVSFTADESLDFTIKCEDIPELVRLQKMLGVKSPSIRCEEFMQRIA
jgi:uncharacterized protein YihD (DUF1040 family)